MYYIPDYILGRVHIRMHVSPLITQNVIASAHTSANTDS